MSSTNRGAERRPADDYPSPPWTVEALLDFVRLPPSMHVLDPCAGEGAVLAVAYGREHHTAGIEIRPECSDTLSRFAAESEIADGLKVCQTPYEGWAVVTNPPFSLAKEFVQTWAARRVFAAFLLPLNFLGVQKRAAWWQGREPDLLLVLPRRPAFVAVCKRGGKKGCGASVPVADAGSRCACGGRFAAATDSCEYGWFVWDRRRTSGGARVGFSGIKVLSLEACGL